MEYLLRQSGGGLLPELDKSKEVEGDDDDTVPGQQESEDDEGIVDDVPSLLPFEDLAGGEDLHKQEEVCVICT